MRSERIIPQVNTPFAENVSYIKKADGKHLNKVATTFLQPRSFWGSFIMIAVLSGALGTIAFTWAISSISKTSFPESLAIGNLVGGFFGIGMGLSLAWLVRVAKFSVVFNDKRDFYSRVNIILAEIGYHPESQIDDLITYKPSIYTGIMGGKISVQVYDEFADILGPWQYIKVIEKKLCG